MYPPSPIFFFSLAVSETTVSHSHRDSHQSQLATVVWVLLDLGIERGGGVDGTFFGDLRPIIGAFTLVCPLEVCPQESRLNGLADLLWIQMIRNR